MRNLVVQGDALLAKIEAMTYAAPNLTRAMVEQMGMAQDLRRILDTFDLLPESKQQP